MSKYDGPSYLRNDHPKIEPIQGKPKDKKVPKYELPDSVRTREDLQKEADQYMETPSYMNRRFRSTQIPKSLRHLDGWKMKRRNEALIEEIRQRLAKESSDYLLFEEFLKEDDEPSVEVADVESEPESEPKSESEKVKDSEPESELESVAEPEPKPKPEPEPKSEPKPVEQTPDTVNLVREDLTKLNFNKKPAAINQVKAKKSSRKKVVRSTQKNLTKKLKPNTGLKRSLSNIIADDKKAMEHWNSNLGSLFINEKN